MAVLGPPLAYARRVALKGLFTVTNYRGQIVAASWPGKHRARPKLTEKDRRQWLSDIVLATHYMDSGTTALVADTFGGSPALARDFLIMMLHGTAFAIQKEDGTWLLPIRFRNLMWKALDQITHKKRGIPTRHQLNWITTGAGAPGQVLTSRGSGLTPTWQ